MMMEKIKKIFMNKQNIRAPPKTRAVLGNPSLMHKRFPETLRVEGNLLGVGNGFPDTS